MKVKGENVVIPTDPGGIKYLSLPCNHKVFFFSLSSYLHPCVKLKGESVVIPTSVATAQPMFFSENGYTVPNKISKILEIFDKIEELKS
jgi:hypothetical protein